MPSSGGSAGGYSNTPAGAAVYRPAAQPTADVSWWNALNPMFNTAISGEQAIPGSPSAIAYQASQGPTSAYLTANPYADQAIQGPQNAYQYDINSLFPQTANNASGLQNAGNVGVGYANTTLSNAFDPGYNSVIGAMQGNPYYAGAQQGANYASTAGLSGAQNLTNYGATALNQSMNPEYGNLINAATNSPYFAGAMGGAQQGAGLGATGANALQGAAGSLLNTGFDPQEALFARGQNQMLDQSNVANSMAGVGNTPYGASVTSNALGNFDINWQNQQLAREAQAAGAASPLFQAAPGLAASSGALPTLTNQQQLGNIGQQLNQANTAGLAGLAGYGSALPTATNLAIQGGAAPSGAYQNFENSILSALNARGAAGQQGAGAYNNLMGGAGNALQTGNALGTNAASTMAGLAGQPYSQGATIGGNALSGLTNQMNIGNTAFQLPQQMLTDLQAYMGLGQDASNLSGQLGQMGINQLAQGIGGGLSAANSLFGGGGSSGSGLLGGLGLAGGGGGGLFSGLGATLGGGYAPSATGIGTNLLTGATSDVLGSGVPASGFFSQLAAALPFAASGA